MTAHARNTDPETSHQAASAIDSYVTPIQRVVEEYALSRPDGFTDAEMCEHKGDTSSTLRTRRAELTERNVILDSGERRTFGDSVRERIVWKHRSFFTSPPPIKQPLSNPEREAVLLKAQGRLTAAKMRGWAEGQRKMGFEMFADGLREAAQVMEDLSK